MFSFFSYKNIFVYKNDTLDRSRYDTTNISTYSWNIAFRQLKFLQKGGVALYSLSTYSWHNTVMFKVLNTAFIQH